MGERLIDRERSVIVAADVEASKFRELIEKTCLVEGIGGYKIGFELGLELGLPNVVAKARSLTDLPLIYDHQKAGNDIPETSVNFARVCKKSGIEAVILFPFTGPVAQTEWTKACMDEGLIVLTGGEMTHKSFLRSDGGYIDDHAPDEIFSTAMMLGVRDFVVPGNKPWAVRGYRKFFNFRLGEGNFTLYAPGFISQGGDITKIGQEAGDHWHAIVGRGIYAQPDMMEAAKQVTRQIR